MTPLTEDQKAEVYHILWNGLTPIRSYIFVLRDFEGQRENLVEYMDRCEAAIDRLIERVKEEL